MDIKVQSILDKIEEKVVELDALREPFIEESILFAKETTNSFMQSAVRANHDVVQNLGVDGLKPIKNELNNIIDSLDTLTRDVLGNHDVWVYKHEIDLKNINELESRSFFINGRRLPEKFEELLRSLLSPVGGLLIKYKLDNSDSWKTQNGKPRYVYGLPTTEGLLASAKIFSKKHQEYESLIRELKEANKEVQQSSALNLWDSI